jgi:hypothetical protein
MAAAAKLLIDIATDIAKLRSDFGAAKSVVSDFGRDIEKIGGVVKTALGGIGVGLSVGGIKAFVDSIGDIADQAAKVQLGTDSFQALQAAMRDAGITGETSLNLIAKASDTLGKAFDGNKEQVELLQRLKVGLIDAKGNAASFEETLPRVAKAILAIENPMQRASAAAAFFGGKVGKEAIPALEAMARGTDELKKQFESEIVPQAVIERFDRISDQLAGAAKQATVFAAITLDKLIPQETVTLIEEAATGFGKMADAIERVRKGAADAGGDRVQGNILTGLTLSKETVDDIINLTLKWAQSFGAPQAEIEKTREALTKLRQAQVDLVVDVIGRAPSPSRQGNYGPAFSTLSDDPFKGFPKITSGGGVDKFAEAMARLRAETDATKLALDKFNEAMASGLPQKEAERQAKLLADIGTKQAQMIKGVEDAGQQKQIKTAVEALERLKAEYESVKATQQIANEVNAKYGDGTKVLADRMFELDKALAANKITQEEYAAAVKDANEASERQKLIHEGMKEGIEGVAAGFSFAALSMTQAQSEFQLGQDLFQAGFQTLSGAISEFVDKGTIDFGRLAKAFAAMLLEMAIRWAAMSFLRSAFSSLGGGGAAAHGPGGDSGGGGFFSRASGGPVWPGQAFWVGEHGAEKFVPTTAGTIIPNGGGGGLTVNVNNYAQAKVTANQRRGPGGGMNLDVLIEPIEALMAGRMQRGQGAMVGSLEGTYGLTRQGRRG